MRTLTQELEELFSTATEEMLHTSPEGHGEARKAWDEAAAEVHLNLRRMLQREVRALLA